ncbi:hypothetical protein [Acidimangrovimonas sediminis]|uniref:hypothetical protein n=1 Tax=Acidimangrovimonas sediminis TaxID=2056283 RepID=UPI000C7F9A5F|nr:hypothetical protein [Acidimangrovimonas sediminis]
MESGVSVLRIDERAYLDAARLAELSAEHGVVEAENLMTRAVGELALILAAMVRHYVSGDLRAFARELRRLRFMAGQVGMPSLAAATEGVSISLERGDSTALAATWARCLRLGESSLQAEWEAQDLSG